MGRCELHVSPAAQRDDGRVDPTRAQPLRKGADTARQRADARASFAQELCCRLHARPKTYLGKQSELLPFFGVPAVTNVATSKLAMISGAVVLPYFFRRLPNNEG